MDQIVISVVIIIILVLVVIISVGVKNGRKSVFHKNVGRRKGLEMWRIENCAPAPYPKKDYGKFYTADSYIILNTTEIHGVLSHDIHYWRGNKTNSNVAVCIAMLTDLDDCLGLGPVQHREVQEYESPIFHSYFPKGIRYLKGGLESGTNKVAINPSNDKRLFHLRGRQIVRIRQVELNIRKMNRYDYFILDSGHKLFIYPPHNINVFQKPKVNEIAKQIRDQDHNSRATIKILDHPISLEDQTEFFGLLGCKLNNPEIPDVPEEGDKAMEMDEDATVTLYNATTIPGYAAGFIFGLLKITMKPLTQDMLKGDICSILDTGYGIFVWIGKEATPDDKSHAMVKAHEFISKHKYPKWTQIKRIVEGSETVQFKQYFATWRETQQLKIKHTQIDGKDCVEFDPSSFHSRKKSGISGFMPKDNGRGNLALWRAINHDLVEVREEMRGLFFDKNCYVIKYNSSNGEGSVVYFWQGKYASILDKGASALRTLEVAGKIESGAIQVLVNQGYEPRHFLKIFQGKLITLFGSHAEFLKNRDDNIKPSAVQMFKVRGTTEDNVHAEQLEAECTSLASDSTFILATPTLTFVWMGVASTESEKRMGEGSVDRLWPGTGSVKVKEGAEPDLFWKALGGKDDYDKELQKRSLPFSDTRLFDCRIVDSGGLVVKEILNFFQDDLDVQDVFILDGGDKIFVWEGKDSSKETMEKSMQLASSYIRTVASARARISILVYIIKQGNEPTSFKQLFPKWKNSVSSKLNLLAK